MSFPQKALSSNTRHEAHKKMNIIFDSGSSQWNKNHKSVAMPHIETCIDVICEMCAETCQIKFYHDFFSSIFLMLVATHSKKEKKYIEVNLLKSKFVLDLNDIQHI